MPFPKYNILRFVFASISIATILLSITGFPQEKLELILLGFVATFGISHGSLDWLLVRHWRIRQTFSEGIIFIACYSTIVLLTLCVWLWVPAIALLIFLVMSLTHFARDWKDELSPNLALLLGLSTISIPGITYQKEILDIFKLLISGNHAIYFSKALHIIGILSFVASSLIAILQFKKSLSLSAEIIILLIIGTVLQPIIYFSIYFCVLHSTKHMIAMHKIGLFHDSFQAIWSALWPTIVCIIGGTWWCYYDSNLSFSDAVIRATFIGLSALTVPHWILLEVYPAYFECEFPQ